MKIIIFLFFIFITIYHAYSILIIVTALLYHWLASRKYSVTNDKFHLGFIILILITTSVIWTWYALPNNLGLHKGDVQIAHNTFDFIANPASNLIEFIKDIIGNLIGCKYLLFTLIFFIALFIPSINQYQLILFFLILILLPINLILYVDIKSSYWFVQRQFIWTMPLFAFFLGWLGDILIMRFCKK